VIISGSFWRKSLVTAVAAGAFISLYETTTLDSKYAARQATLRETTAPPAPGSRLAFSATAYCKGITTASGVPVQSGIVAADPELLPVGSVVDVDSLPAKYNGIYTVLDTGPAVQGRQLDVYMWSCNEALAFGRRPIHLTVMRMGWNPRATTPGFLERVFKRPEPAPLPSRPLPLGAAPFNARDTRN
jgi:3D (Asp-Asp-Asp) domain-containing protein